MSRPGHLEVFVAQILANPNARCRVRLAGGQVNEYTFDEYASLPLATVLGSVFLGLVEVGS